MALISEDLIIEPDMKIKDGDISLGISDDRNIQYIVYADPGQFRKSPTLGVSIIKFTNAPTQDGRNIRKKIRTELEKDGYLLKQLETEILPDESTDIKIKAVKNKSKL
ncbi:MAG: hypothetical protein QQN55_01150 [Nitrosopumilus sp.]